MKKTSKQTKHNISYCKDILYYETEKFLKPDFFSFSKKIKKKTSLKTDLSIKAYIIDTTSDCYLVFFIKYLLKNRKASVLYRSFSAFPLKKWYYCKI